MVSRNSHCDQNRLKRLLDDRMPQQGQTELAEHLETCRSCREQLELLAAHPSWWAEASKFLGDAPATDVFPEQQQPSLEFLAPADDPNKLGRLDAYEIEEVIGSGGMGIVLRGYDASLNRHVAIKVLAPQLATSAAARQRFAREAQAAAAVVHEHVVAIHAVDSSGTLPYLVMPLVSGRSLQQRLEATGPLHVEEILRIGRQIAAGLAAAHAQGLVHRDVKPANILLENGVERVMITDFGLARAIDDASLTCSGVVAGTPQYMSPEQADGRAIDHRSDLFSLGSVIYAMCTGRSPFRAKGTMGVLRRICDQTPSPIREINPQIPRWLAELIAKLHEKNPDERFQTATEVAELLGQYLAHVQHPTSVPKPRRLAASRCRLQKRRKMFFRMSVAAALLLAGGLAIGELTGTTQWLARTPDSTVRPEADRSRVSQVEPPEVEIATAESAVSVGVLPLEMPMAFEPLGDGFRQQIESIRVDLGFIEEGLYTKPDPELPIEDLSLIGSQLGALERELDPPPSDLLTDVSRRLDELEQEVRSSPPVVSDTLDRSIHALGIWISVLEQEVVTNVP